jgi:hypothetical protein
MTAMALPISPMTFQSSQTFLLSPDRVDAEYIAAVSEDVGKGFAAITEEILPKLAIAARAVIADPTPGAVIQDRLALRALDGRRTQPLSLRVERDGVDVVVVSESLDLFATGASLLEAEDNLAEKLDMLASHYLNTPVERLTASGQRLRARIRELIEG